uniref:Uncharacterized protein n=1 Tax=Anguilla anguilla TaxID=7936 RepID=A0A0E9VHG6_ANGAN
MTSESVLAYCMRIGLL